MRSEVDEFPVRDINETGYLLIPSRFPPVPIYGRIANGNDEQFVKHDQPEAQGTGEADFAQRPFTRRDVSQTPELEPRTIRLSKSRRNLAI